jgi:P4 family phage/plasmid primase-like protien
MSTSPATEGINVTATPRVQAANGQAAGDRVRAVLQPQHLEKLHRSSLTDETILACGFTTVTCAKEIREILGWKRYRGELGPCLKIMYYIADGRPMGHARLRPDKPRQDRDTSKSIKYEAPMGCPNRLYVPPGTRAALRDATVPLGIAESEIKAAAVDQIGIPCVGICGVYAWMRKREKGPDGKPTGEPELIADMADLAWENRTVYIIFDSDISSNRNVATAAWRLAGILKRHGAIVKVVKLPHGPADVDGNAEKVGADDFLAANGPDALRKLIAEAADPSPPVGVEAIEADDDPHRLAKLFLDRECRHPDGATLRWHNEQYYQWDRSQYVAVADAEMRARLTGSVKAEMDRLNKIAQLLAAENGEKPEPVYKITKSLITNTEQALASLTLLPGAVAMPAWWDGQEWIRRNVIAMSNGILDLDALFAGRDDVLLPHTPRWFCSTCLPYPFDPDADCPCWRAFLDRNLEADVERIALLQELFGLNAVHDMAWQRFTVFEGEGANGKSVACAALEGMVGPDNCSHVTLELFGERFQLFPTIGKLANIVAEIGEVDKVAEGILKQFTSGDPMQFDRKFKSPVQAAPTARLTFATNNRPRFTDRSGGLWRRMILFPFRVVIAENDPTRVRDMDKPEWWLASGELPGVLNWALAGLYRLRQQKQFTRSAVCEQALDEYRIESNPAKQFLLDNCRERPDGQTPCGELYRAYSVWCKGSGYAPLGERQFGKEVRRAFPKAERREIGPRGSSVYCYCGIAADNLHRFHG